VGWGKSQVYFQKDNEPGGYEPVEITSSLQLGEEENAIIWQYNSSAVYSVKSLYAIVNKGGGGVKQVYTLVMWKIKVPPRIHIFLWLLSNNKVLTRDNLAKRKQLDDNTCLFCKEAESTNHIFSECCVARLMWDLVAEITGLPRVNDFISLGKCWVMGKNMMT
jgi:hypothetical protein